MRNIPGIIIVALMFFTVNDFAQMYERVPQMRLTLQAGIQTPTGDFSNSAATGFGLNGTFEYWQNTPLAFTGSFGYNHFRASEDLPGDWDYSFSDIPIMFGIRYYLSRGDIHPYFGTELGLQIITSSLTRTEGNTTITIDETNSRFGLDPMLGFRYHLTQVTDLDFNIKYNLIATDGGNTDFLGINAGLQMGL